MKRRRGLVLVTAMALSACSAESASSPTLPDGTPDGAALYLQRCAACHGSDGAGAGGPSVLGAQLAERFADDAELAQLIAMGRGGMPGYRAQLSDEQIQAIIDHMRTLG